VQIAAPSLAAVNAGDYLCVVGDFHPGANPLGQSMFAARHPDKDRFLDAIASDVGTLPFLHPPGGIGSPPTRNMPEITRPATFTSPSARGTPCPLATGRCPQPT